MDRQNFFVQTACFYPENAGAASCFEQRSHSYDAYSHGFNAGSRSFETCPLSFGHRSLHAETRFSIWNLVKALPGKIVFSLISILLVLVFFTTQVRADDLWSEEYYRAVDSTGDLSEAQRDEIDKICLEFIQKWHLDLAMLSVAHDRYEDLTISELAESYYEDCGFGYGDSRDGFMMVLYPDTLECTIVAIGSAGERVPKDYLIHTSTSCTEYLEGYGVFGPMYATTKMLNDYLENESGKEKSDTAAGVSSQEENEADSESNKASNSSEGAQTLPVQKEDAGPVLDENGLPDSSLRVGENSDLPAWYPKDPSSFPEYHDANAPRVVDDADLFTEVEEAAMEARLTELRSELEKDIVIYTDTSAYGFDHSIISADFYDFNGYGIGDEYEGVCLYVCMDPADRGWWCCCTGHVTKALYTEDIANQIDDLLYEQFVNQHYYEGVTDWIENFRRLYLTGSPYSSDWVLNVGNQDFQRYHDENAARVVDEAKILTADQIAHLEDKAKQISKQYNVDVVVHTARNEGILSRAAYPELYFNYNGYGFGDDYDGLLLNIFKRPYCEPTCSVFASGSAVSKLTSVNNERLEGYCTDLLSDHEYYQAIDQWLDQSAHMLKTGRAPRSMSDWLLAISLELIVGLIIGAVSLSRARRRMATPAIQERADSYFQPNSLIVNSIRDIHIDTTTTETYSPIEHDDDRSSGGSFSHRSSYSSSYSGSSGRSHSGSGRRF